MGAPGKSILVGLDRLHHAQLLVVHHVAVEHEHAGVIEEARADHGNATTTCSADPGLDGRKEARKTYAEQTKLLVTLAPALIFAPAAIIGL
jgi:hypothetical protein